MLRFIRCESDYSTCQYGDEYSKMDKDGTWDTHLELLCFAHLTKTCVFSYFKEMSNWDRYGPHDVDRRIPVDTNAKSMYLFHPPRHYELVGSVVKATSNPQSSDSCDSKSSDPKSNDSGSKGKNSAATATWLTASRNIQVFEALRFHSVDAQWQADKCSMLGLQLHGPNNLSPGGPNVALTRPHQIRHIRGDGFDAFHM